MDATTESPEPAPQDEPIDMDQLVLRVAEIITSELLPAPPGQMQRVVQSLASSLPRGMTLDQQEEVRSILRHLTPNIPVSVMRKFNGSLPPPAEYPLLDEHRRHMVDFVWTELWVANNDADRIVAAMAQLFQGPLARRPQLCHFRLFCEFNSLIRGRAGEIWLGSLFYAHLAENALRVERLSNIITSYNRLPIYHFTQPGRLYIVDEDLRLSELISTDEEGDLFRSRDNNLVYITWGHIVTGTVTDPFSVPGWLELSTIIRRDPQPQARTVPGPESEGSATTNLLTSRELGIVSLREAFRDVNQQFTAMAADMMALPTSHVLRTLRENDADIHHSEATIDHLFLGNASPGQDGLEIARECLARVHGRLFEVERYIIEEENLLLTAGRTFRAYSLRYERTRHRYFLKWVVAGLQEPQLRDRFRIPSSVQPAPIARPYEGQDPCPICYEAVEQPEEWLFPKAGTGMTCPWCRASVPMDFLGEVMESRVRELQCL